MESAAGQLPEEASDRLPPPMERASLLVRSARAVGMDRAIGYAVLSKLWQLATGPVTQLLIVFFFSEATQGYYQAFAYLIGMQIFIELGLHVVIINLCSHEWALLRYDGERVSGDAIALARLGSVYTLCQRWYRVAAAVFVLGAGVAGAFFLADATSLHERTELASESVSWFAPWLALVVVTGLQLPLLPVAAMLEGCDQLRTINRIRFWQAVVGTMVVWSCVSVGCGLWTLAASACVRLVGEWWLTRVEYGAFTRSLQSESRVVPFALPSPSRAMGDVTAMSSGGQGQGQGERADADRISDLRFQISDLEAENPIAAAPGIGIDWRTEVLPLQWRIAVQGVLLWFVNAVPGLVVFRWHGDGPTARLGMTWTILTALQAASLAWIETRRPQFGALIAERRFAELDALFFRMTKLSVGLMTLSGCGFAVFVWSIGMRSEWVFERIAGRLLPITPTLQFVAALALLQFALCANFYVRAHKRDPFLVASIVSSVVIASLEIWWGREFGPAGVARGYLLGVACVQVPLWLGIWWKCRREWHAVSAPALAKGSER